MAERIGGPAPNLFRLEVCSVIAMTSAEQVRRVLSEAHRDLMIEDLEEGGAVVREASCQATANSACGFPVSERLSQCANLLADSGFAIAMVRDHQGVYLTAR
jgi:hypothetical protein